MTGPGISARQTLLMFLASVSTELADRCKLQLPILQRLVAGQIAHLVSQILLLLTCHVMVNLGEHWKGGGAWLCTQKLSRHHRIVLILHHIDSHRCNPHRSSLPSSTNNVYSNGRGAFELQLSRPSVDTCNMQIIRQYQAAQ